MTDQTTVSGSDAGRQDEQPDSFHLAANGNQAVQVREAVEYPAAFTVHWATGPVPCCVNHARALINLGRMLGSHIVATGPTEGAQCQNCINEATPGATT